MRIYLRDIKPEDGKYIVKWRNSPYVLDHCFNKSPITIESNSEFFKANILSGKYKQYIVEKIDDSCGVVSYAIATTYLKDIDLINKRCELCIFTSDDKEWNDIEKKIAVKLILKKAFDEFEMHKVYSYVFKSFSGEIELLEKSGFKIESILRNEAVNNNGEFCDVLRMTIFNCKLK